MRRHELKLLVERRRRQLEQRQSARPAGGSQPPGALLQGSWVDQRPLSFPSLLTWWLGSAWVLWLALEISM